MSWLGEGRLGEGVRRALQPRTAPASSRARVGHVKTERCEAYEAWVCPQAGLPQGLQARRQARARPGRGPPHPWLLDAQCLAALAALAVSLERMDSRWPLEGTPWAVLSTSM